MFTTSLATVGHVALACGLTFLLGFERQLRGSVAGDRTFSLIGIGTAVIGVLAAQGNALSILSGAVTGVGFIGAGLLFRQSDEAAGATVHGVTTASSIVAAGGIGAAAGEGQLWLAVVATAAVILILELRYIPYLRVLDARRWEHHFKDDADPHHRHRSTVTVTVTTNGSPGHDSTANAAKDVALKESALESVSESAAADSSAGSAPADAPSS